MLLMAGKHANQASIHEPASPWQVLQRLMLREPCPGNPDLVGDVKQWAQHLNGAAQDVKAMLGEIAGEVCCGGKLHAKRQHLACLSGQQHCSKARLQRSMCDPHRTTARSSLKRCCSSMPELAGKAHSQEGGTPKASTPGVWVTWHNVQFCRAPHNSS